VLTRLSAILDGGTHRRTEAEEEQGLWRIEYLNTGRAKTTICKQIGKAFSEGGFYVSLVCKMTCENYLVWL